MNHGYVIANANTRRVAHKRRTFYSDSTALTRTLAARSRKLRDETF